MTVPRARKFLREAEIERLKQVVEWRKAGVTYRRIGVLLGVSLERARQLAYKSQRFKELRTPGVSLVFDRRGSSPDRTIDEWLNSIDADF